MDRFPGQVTPEPAHRYGKDRLMKSLRFLVAALVAGALMLACKNAEGVNLTAALTGEKAVCKGNTCGGDIAANAAIEISSDGSRLCYRYETRDLVKSGDEGTAAHIHSGEEGVAGPVVVDFISGNEACIEGVSESILRRISDAPANFYVDIHSKRYPDGVARGQLQLDQ
jgi:CHRD domain